MNYGKIIFWLVFTIYWCDVSLGDIAEAMQNVESDSKYRISRGENTKSSYTVLSETISQAVNNENLHETCTNDDIDCLASTSNDPHGLEAIMALHKQLDDDANGNIDLSETGDFLREDLKLNSGYENRQKAFHYNDDMHISVKELWAAWLRSEVHNWTIEQTTEWLSFSVELPQYVPHFIRNKVAGSRLPQLAVNNNNYLSVLGIKDPIHKQKIALKAMDVVLFGPPKDGHHHWKDFTLIVLTIGGGIGVWYAYQQNKKFRRHLTRMNRDMEGLQSAERALGDLQMELIQAKAAKENVVTEKEYLEKRLQESDATGLHHSYSDLEVSQLKQEIEMLRAELQIAEGELKDRLWSAPPGLQQWLQLTHEIENKSFLKKRAIAEKQLQQAREACEKLRKKRSSVVGAFVSTHGKSIDEVDRSIVEARTSLNEVTNELQERVHRWKQVELLLGFNITNNNGLQYLENCLYRTYNGRSALSMRGRMSSQDELDDETSSIYAPSVTGGGAGGGNYSREMESSGSETSRQEDDNITSLSMQTMPFSTSGDGRDGRHGSNNTVHFLLGGEVTNWNDDSSNIVTKPSQQRNSPQPQTTTTTSANNTTTNTTTNTKQQSHVANNNNNTHNKQSNNNTTPSAATTMMTRSQSQEVSTTTTTTMASSHHDNNGNSSSGGAARHVKASSYSDTALDKHRLLTTTPPSPLTLMTAVKGDREKQQRPQTINENTATATATTTVAAAVVATATSGVVEDDVCSTDSSVIDDDVRNKRKKRKFFAFGRKSDKSKAE